MDLVEEALKDKLPERAISFFVVFSRFECAMKRIGTYARSSASSVEADWDKLAKDLGKSFFERVLEEGCAQDLIGKPPKKQIILADGRLGWRDELAVTDVSGLFLAIRRARNNLFHGGKYQDDGSGNANMVDGAERSDALLEQSIIILSLVLEKKEDLYGCYRKF